MQPINIVHVLNPGQSAGHVLPERAVCRLKLIGVSRPQSRTKYKLQSGQITQMVNKQVIALSNGSDQLVIAVSTNVLPPATTWVVSAT